MSAVEHAHKQNASLRQANLSNEKTIVKLQESLAVMESKMKAREYVLFFFFSSSFLLYAYTSGLHALAFFLLFFWLPHTGGAGCGGILEYSWEGS